MVGSVEDTLQFVGRLLRRVDQQTSAVVDPAGDERVNNSSSGGIVVE